MNKRLTFIIGYIFIVIATFVAFYLITFYNVFRKKQPTLENSYNSGFGHYSDPIKSNGLNGVQKVTKKCIIHPVTGKGCINEEGAMTYDDIVQTLPYQKQNIGSAFEVSDGLEFTKVLDNDQNEYHLIHGSGGGHIVNNFGIDYTDYFIDSFDWPNNKYKLKRCFDQNEYQTYSVQTHTCVVGDSDKASNNCIFTCGVDDNTALRMTTVKDPNLNLKVPQYPKVNGRYVCLDVFGNNQIEIFNTGNIPNDFTYPNQCYEHFYQEGISYTFQKRDNVNSSQKYYTLLNTTLAPYELIYDFNFYHPLEIGSENSIVEKIVNNDTYVNQQLSEIGYLYLDMESNYDVDTLILGNNLLTLSKNIDFFPLSDNNIIGINLNLFLGANRTSPYFYSTDNQMVLSYSGTSPVVGDYVYYRINSYELNNQANFAKVDNVDTSNNTFGMKISNLGEDAYQYGIQFSVMNSYFGEEINIQGSNDGLSPGNRIDNNKYFLSDLLLPQDTTSVEVNQVVDIYNQKYFDTSSPDATKFYLYSQNFNAYYYPVSRANVSGSTRFNLPLDYGNTDFYLLDGGLSRVFEPPNKYLNYPFFEDLTGYIQGEIITNSYGNFTNYIKQIKLLSTGLDFENFDKKFVIATNNFSSFYQINNFIRLGNNSTTIKKLGLVVEEEIEDEPFIDKMLLYNQILETIDVPFSNTYGVSYDIKIQPKKAIVEKANYDVFRSPQRESDSNNICFDQFNRPLPVGTKVQLQPGEKVLTYVKEELNASDYGCGNYGVSGDTRVVQQRELDYVELSTDAQVSTEELNYRNYSNFLSPGYELEKLYCFNGTSCREPFTTRKYDLNTYYNPEEDLLSNYQKRDLYLSQITNNVTDPTSANNWKAVKKYKGKDFINYDDNVYSQRNNDTFIYKTNNPGFTGEELSKIGVYYLYNKQLPVFQDPSEIINNGTFYAECYTYNNYNQLNWIPEGTPYSGFVSSGDYHKYRYLPKEIREANSNNFTYSIDINVLPNNSGSSLYQFQLALETQNIFEVGDYINPDFNLFNSILLNDGVSVFSFNSNSGHDALTQGTSIIDNITFNSNAKVNDLIFIAYDKDFDFFTNYTALGTSIYNYSFEVCKILGINNTGMSVTLERNLLNYPKESLFNGDLNGNEFVAYLLDPNFDTKLLYPITQVTDNINYFNFSAYSYNPPNISNIFSNLESRTNLSCRIIKNNIQVPFNNFDNGNKLMLLSSPQKNRLSSYLDMMFKEANSDGSYSYYFNEFKSNLNYINNSFETTFNIGDTVTINSFNGANYDLLITGVKTNYRGSIFDYSSTIYENIPVPNTLANTFFNIGYYDSTRNIIGYIDGSITPTSDNNIDYLYPVTGGFQINYLASNLFNNQYYQYFANNSSDGNIDDPNFIQNFSNQKLFDLGNLVKITLKSTNLYTDLNTLNSYVTIDNITSNEKVYGPTYLKNLANSNDLDYSGYGTITSFDINGVFLEETPNNGIVLRSKSGFEFVIVNEVASFNFETVVRNNNLKNYQIGNTYGINETAYFHTNNNLIYNNTNTVVSKFNPEGDASYNQPYYILDSGLYKYPLYLKEESGYSSKINNGVSLYYDPSDYNSSSTLPNQNIYKEFTIDQTRFRGIWKQVADSFYPIIPTSNYSTNQNYDTGDIVEYNNNIYQANNPNFNQFDNNWSLYNGYSQLYNTQSLFFNQNVSSIDTPAGLSISAKLDTINNPISLIDYSNQDYYSFYLVNKFIDNYEDTLGGFLDLDIFSLQRNILAKIIMLQNPTTDSVASLATSPATLNDIPTYGFLKQFPVYQSGQKLSQYIYDLSLPDKNFAGKVFCEGNTPFNSQVSSYEFSNSISFLPTPIDLEYQDFPFVNYVHGFTNYTVLDLYPNSIFSYPGSTTSKAIINNSIENINFGKSYYKSIETTFKNSYLAPGKKIFITDGYMYTVISFTIPSDTKYNYYVAITPSDFTENYYDNQPFVLKDAKGNILGGGLIKLKDGFRTSLSMEDLFLAVLYDDYEKETSCNIVINNQSFSAKIIKLPLSLNFITSNNITSFYEGEFYIIADNQIITYFHLHKYYSGIFTAYNKYLTEFDKIAITTSLTESGKLYFLPQEISLKTKFYGFFQNSYMSPIGYQTKNLIPSLTGDIPNLILSPLTNQLLNPIKSNIQLIDSDGSVIVSDIPYDYYSDVFNLTTNQAGTSLVLKSNPFKYPLFNPQTGELNPNNIFLDTTSNEFLGMINNDSVTQLTSSQVDINNYVILGGISNVIPIGEEFDAKTQYYRQTKDAVNSAYNFNLNCSLFQIEETEEFPIQDTVNSYLQDGTMFNIQEIGTSSTYLDKTIPQIPTNKTLAISQDSPTNNNLPIYIGLSGGDQFSDSLIYDLSNDISIKYYLNNNQLTSSSKYYDPNGEYNFSSINVRRIEIVAINNDIFSEFNEKTIYFGVSDSNGARPFTSNGISIARFF